MAQGACFSLNKREFLLYPRFISTILKTDGFDGVRVEMQIHTSPVARG